MSPRLAESVPGPAVVKDEEMCMFHAAGGGNQTCISVTYGTGTTQHQCV